MINENLLIKREAVPLVFKVIADAEQLLTELTGSRVTLEMKLNSPVFTKEEILKLSVQRAVVSEFAISWADIIGNNRKREFVDARKAYAYIMNLMVGQKLVDIAADLQVHHTSVIHLRDSCRQLMSINDPIKDKILNIKTKLYEYFN